MGGTLTLALSSSLHSQFPCWKVLGVGRRRGKLRVNRHLLTALGLLSAHLAALERPLPRPTTCVPRPHHRSSLTLTVRGGCQAPWDSGKAEEFGGKARRCAPRSAALTLLTAV